MSTRNLSSVERAELRRATRDHLANRPSIAQSPRIIHRSLRREFSCEEADVADACEFLRGLNQLTASFDPLGGGEKYYQISPSGILAHERGE